ncbi:MAG: hypothetical protein U0797_24365 [Gemmataceae bacterium]
MTSAAFEQRNPYKGSPERPWIRVRLRAADGSDHELELLADTGSPFAIILGEALFLGLKHRDISGASSGFGAMTGGWLQVVTPELGVDTDLVGYGSDDILTTVQASSTDFLGLAGLPLLRLMEYGGDADAFWVRSVAAKP